MADIVSLFSFWIYCLAPSPQCVWRLSVKRGEYINFTNLMDEGRGQVKEDDKLWDVCYHFQGSSVTSQVLKAVKVMHFSRDHLLKTALHDSLMFTGLHNSSYLVQHIWFSSQGQRGQWTKCCSSSLTNGCMLLHVHLHGKHRALLLSTDTRMSHQLKWGSVIKVCFIEDNKNDGKLLMKP